MEKIGLSHRPKRNPRGITKAEREARKSDDLLKRNFTSEKPLEKCVTDTTEIKAKDGKLYVSAIFDCFDSAVLGLAMETTMKATLCQHTVENAFITYSEIRGTVLHSDRGTQYTSELYRSTLRKYEIIQSMNSAGGRCHDNARCKSMWSRLKIELLYDRYNSENHIIFNSTTLDCTRKFRDFRLSSLALARLSDIVCLEHRLSVIIRKLYGERQERTEYPEKKSQRDEICEAIDAALARKPKDFRELIGILQEAGYEYKDGKQPAMRGKGHARFARFRSLGKGYSVEELCEVIAGNAVHKSKFAEKNRTSARSAQVHQNAELSFLIDVRAKMQAGKGVGYARWAKVFNLKQMAKAMMFMEEHGIKSYAELKEKADGISEKCDALLESVKADEERMSEVSVLRKHLINYAKAKDVFAAYKASGYNREFYEAHRDTLALRSAAKKAFDAYKKENGSDKKLPRISELNAEYAMLLERKKSSYAEYRKTKSEMQDWLVAQKIVQEILKEDEQKKEQLHEQEVRQEEENRQSSR